MTATTANRNRQGITAGKEALTNGDIHAPPEVRFDFRLISVQGSKAIIN